MSERDEETVTVTWKGVTGYGIDEITALLNAQDTYRSTVLKEGPDDAAAEYEEREGAAVYIIRDVKQLAREVPLDLLGQVGTALSETGNIVVRVEGEKRLYLSSEEFVDEEEEEQEEPEEKEF